MLNSCDFQGRLAADPELRTTQTGKQVASFRMAVDRDMVDANGHRPTDWLTFTAYSLFLFLHKKCRPPLTASCSVRSVFRLPV